MTTPKNSARATRWIPWAVGAILTSSLLVGGAYWFLSPPGPSPVVQPPTPPEGLTGPSWFRDMTGGSGIDYTYRNGEEADQYTILESLGGGVGLLDYDGDGLLDVFIVGGGTFTGADKQEIKGHPCKLYRNLGGWKFEDVTLRVGLETIAWWYTHGVAVADVDRDGWPDLLVTGYEKIALYKNVADEKGGRRFVDVTRAYGLNDTLWSTSAGWGDLDGDGYPDLYVCHYVDWSWGNNPVCKGNLPGVARDVCAPQKFKPLVHSLYRNEKGQKFTDESARQKFTPTGCGLGVVLVDVNDDRKPDLYVGNDASNNYLFLNRSAGSLALEEKGVDAGVALNEYGRYDGSMGVDAGDFNGTGRPSLWVTNFQGDLHGLYANRGGERFEHSTRAAGLGAIGMHWVGFGTGFVDVDRDGWEDIVIVNGHVVRKPIMTSTFRQKPLLMRNVEYQGRRFFEAVSSLGGPYFQTPALGRGLAIGDLDNDGRPDLVISHSNTPVSLLRNVAGEDTPTRWLGVQVRGKDGRDVVGSTLVLELEDGRRLTRFAKGGGSYLSASDPRILFGLTTAGTIKRLTVRWSWGQEQHWDGAALEVGCYWEVREGELDPRKIASPAPR